MLSTTAVATGSDAGVVAFPKIGADGSSSAARHDLELASRRRPGPEGEGQEAGGGEGREAQDERVHVAASPPARIGEGKLHGRESGPPPLTSSCRRDRRAGSLRPSHALGDPMRSTGGPGHVRYRLDCRQRLEARRLRFVTLLGLGQEPGTSPLTDGNRTTSYHSVRVAPATQASPARPTKPDPLRSRRGPPLQSALTFPRQRARPRTAVRGIEGDFSSRREMDLERRLSLLDEASDGRLCDQP